MALTTKVASSFWSGDEVGGLGPPEKLALLWLKTTKDMTNIGHLKVSKRQFEFDTGLPCKVLEGALKGLPSSFLFGERNGVLEVLELERVAEQFGDRTLSGKNHIVKHLCGLLAELSEPFRDAILERYEDLARAYEGAVADSRGLQAPYKGPEQSRAEQRSVPDLSPSGRTQPEGAENSAEKFHVERSGHSGAHRGQNKNGLRYDLAEEVLKFLNAQSGSQFLGTPAVLFEVASRLREVGQDAEGVKKMVARQVAMWRGDGKMRDFLRPATLFEQEKFANYFGQRDQDTRVSNAPDRAAELRELIDTSRANRESSYHSSQATEEEKEQLKKWRAELRAAGAKP